MLKISCPFVFSAQIYYNKHNSKNREVTVMFFIMGSGTANKQLDFDQLIICKSCGKYGHIKIIELYSYFSVFFIPIFKWNKRYIAHMSCCGESCEIDTEIGKEIAGGQRTELSEEMLTFQNRTEYNYKKRCTMCGYETAEDFEFCPKCGNRF